MAPNLPNGNRLAPWMSSETSTYSSRPSMLGNLISTAEKFQRRVLTIYNRLSVLQRVLAAIILVVLGVSGLLFLIFNEKIFGWLEPLAEKWKHTTGGWVILWAITFVAAFPPLIGYSTCATTAGFIYGVGEGWLILASATVAGSFCSFLVSRTILRRYVERMVEKDTRFAALALVLKHEGLKLLVMIRFCPLPYSFSNGALSTIPTVDARMYALATAIITPKLFIHVFIGSRLAEIARHGGQMSAGTKAVNYISIAVGAIIGTTVGLYIYRKTLARARELEEEEAQNVRSNSRTSGDLPHPQSFSDDTEAQLPNNSMGQDSDAVDYFDDETATSPQRYRDEDTDDDVFRSGDGRDDGTVGTNR